MNRKIDVIIQKFFPFFFQELNNEVFLPTQSSLYIPFFVELKYVKKVPFLAKQTAAVQKFCC